MSYDHGRFVWFELLTKDIDKAISFYSQALPWRIEPMTMQDGSSYNVIKVGDQGIGGFVSPKDDVPTAWVSYVSVANVDEAAQKIEACGGIILGDAFDVPGVGRMQPVSDRHSGMFRLFKAETADPPRVEGPGSFHWNELWSHEPPSSIEFYEGALGYTHEEITMPNGAIYYVFKDGEAMRGGMIPSPSVAMPTIWLPYIEVDDCDATLARAKQSGATVVAEPIDAEGIGRIAMFSDPLGGMIGLIKPASA